MTSLDVVEDVELLEHLDETRLCTPWKVTCEKEATWVAIAKCCGFEMPLCDKHKKGHEIETWLLMTLVFEVECRVCKTILDTSEPGAVRYERIK